MYRIKTDRLHCYEFFRKNNADFILDKEIYNIGGFSVKVRQWKPGSKVIRCRQAFILSPNTRAVFVAESEGNTLHAWIFDLEEIHRKPLRFYKWLKEACDYAENLAGLNEAMRQKISLAVDEFEIRKQAVVELGLIEA